MTGVDKGQLLRIEAATIVARAISGGGFNWDVTGPHPLARFIAEAAEALEPYLRGPGYTVSPGEACSTCEAVRAADARARSFNLGAQVVPMRQYQPPKGKE